MQSLPIPVMSTCYPCPQPSVQQAMGDGIYQYAPGHGWAVVVDSVS